MNQKIEIENRGRKMKLKIGFCVLVCIFGFVFCSSNFQNEKSSLEIEMQELNFNNENEESNFGIEVEPIKSTETPFFKLLDGERDAVCYVVAGEAKGEPMEGKMAVAQCLLNAMIKEEMSAEEVKKEFSYSGWDTELQNSNLAAWDEVKEAVSRVFDNGEFVSENPILFFYSPKNVTSKWHESLEFDQTIGGHKFFYLEEDLTADWFLNLKK